MGQSTLGKRGAQVTISAEFENGGHDSKFCPSAGKPLPARREAGAPPDSGPAPSPGAADARRQACPAGPAILITDQ